MWPTTGKSLKPLSYYVRIKFVAWRCMQALTVELASLTIQHAAKSNSGVCGQLGIGSEN